MVRAPAYGPRLRPGASRREARRRAALQDHSFVFIHIPKTGGTSIRTALDFWSAHNHFTAREIRQIYPESSGKFSFAFVRNPWDRLVSYGHSFTVPVDWDQPNRFDRLDLRPQVDFILDDDGAPMVDFIGKFETLVEDFATVCDMIGIATPPLPHANSTEHRQYRDYYDETTKQFVAVTYAADIERFGYSF